MIKKLLESKKNYITIPSRRAKLDVPDGLIVKCQSCKGIIYRKELVKNFKVCKMCNHYFPMTAKERVKFLLDKDSFLEYDEAMVSNNPLDFPEYKKKLKQDQKKTNLNEAVITGEGRIQEVPIVLAIMDPGFRMGSMGSVVGEKIARAMEKAMETRRAFLIFSASGGARMQEGIISLMQMAKTSAAAKMLDLNGNLYISVMTSPTTGGVSASFASLGDYNFAEPGALIGFAGRRIIEQTIREELPEDFQTAEFLLKKGQLDRIIPREEMREVLGSILNLHYKGEDF
jgi:acetyl-CoA carboxylase carboxyl transferase subunit beta